MCSYLKWIHISVLWIHVVRSMSLIKQHSYFMDGADNDVADIMLSKGYIPGEKTLQESSVVKNVDNDVTYLLSKLSDDELIKLLSAEPKKELYDLNDIVKVAVNGPSIQSDNKIVLSFDKSKQGDSYPDNPSFVNKRFRTISDRGQINDKDLLNLKGYTNDRILPQKSEAFFRLEDKHVEPYNTKSDVDGNYAALQKINNLLYSRPQEEVSPNLNSDEEDERKELLFDVLVAQLRTLCCKKRTKSRDFKKQPIKSLLSEIITPQNYYSKTSDLKISKEFMFLIINDEIKGNGSEELISVDPESLDKNSSVLLLGPIVTPLSNPQLKAVMTRISKELSKPDYVPLLQQISEGTLTGNNIRLMNSLVTGPDTRRYIKPHRCNHQSPLAKVYGGPKWIICTGYLNLNKVSLYD